MIWYEDEVHELETKRTQSAEPVVFYGSSSIRLWTTLAEDFPDLNTVNLGFGGSTLAACAWFFERLVVPTQPRSVVFYAGDNDLGDGRHPEEVYLFFRVFADKMRQHLPDVPLTYLTIKISPARWNLADQIRRTNQLISDEVGRMPKGQLIDTTSPLLNADGRPQSAYFESDGLHLNPTGYQAWRDALHKHLTYF